MWVPLLRSLPEEIRHVNFFWGTRMGSLGLGAKSLCRKPFCAFSVPYVFRFDIQKFFGASSFCKRVTLADRCFPKTGALCMSGLLAHNTTNLRITILTASTNQKPGEPPQFPPYTPPPREKKSFLSEKGHSQSNSQNFKVFSEQLWELHSRPKSYENPILRAIHSRSDSRVWLDTFWKLGWPPRARPL